MLDSIIHSTGPETNEVRVTYGRLMSKENYFPAAEAAVPLQQYVANLDPQVLQARDLVKFQEVSPDYLSKTVCLPTTTLMAMSHLKPHSLGLEQFYQLGIYVHTNDRHNQGETQKGFPSFHRESLDTYLRYALEFALLEGLGGGVLTRFESLDFIHQVLKIGGVAILSVDNLFIPKVMNQQLDSATFKPSRHAEMVHALAGDRIIISDVTDRRNGKFWNTLNRPVTSQSLIEHLTCPRLDDYLTRALILTPTPSDWQNKSHTLDEYGTVYKESPNPILEPFINQGVSYAISALEPKVNAGTAQWHLIDKV